MKSKGIVYLVGAGPGDPGLLTLRGAELLKRADVVVYDALVNAELLRLAPATAEIIYGGKRAKDHTFGQGELNTLLVSKAREGKVVVRLKGGDPYVFGRGGEEAEELAEAKVPFEVVPGISSVIAAANYAGIPLTHREHSSSFTVITGHEDPEKGDASVDWAHFAKDQGTKVILMGMERIRSIMDQLAAHGMDPTTPVGLVRWGTTGRQESLYGTIASIAAEVERAQFTAPAIAVIGEVVHLRDQLNWFEKRSLFSKKVVVTRTRDQASQLTQLLSERGADVMEIPTIKIQPPDNRSDLADALLALGEYDWIVFTSPNGVTAFFEYFLKAFEDIRALGNLRVAAVGPATAAKVKEYHVRVDVMPEQYIAAKIADALTKFESIENLKILLMRAEVANMDLPAELERIGAIVDDVACYKTVPESEDATGSAARLMEVGADWVTFTSSSTVENFNARFDLIDLKRKFPQVKFASIGPETSKSLKALGFTPDLEARQHTIEGLVSSIEAAENGSEM
ncbi:MAG: uroporphyrinogen-III C-methyltransferase [Verrucomicrobiales bacterium]